MVLLLAISPQQICSCKISDTLGKNHCNSIQQNLRVLKHEIEIDILSVEEVKVLERYRIENVQNSSVSSIELWINQSTDNIVTSGNLNSDINSISNASHLITLNLHSEFLPNDTELFTLTYDLNNLPRISFKKFYYFQFWSSISYYTQIHTISLRLPYKSTIHVEKDFTSFFPVDNVTAILDPPRVYISWFFYNLEPFENQFCFIYFDKPFQNPPVWVFILGPAGGIAVGVGGSIWFMRRKERRIMKNLGEIFLSESQKEILKLIYENEGKMLQKDICLKTGFSRSRVSRNLVPLEQQGLIEREKWGKNYTIRLTETGRRVSE